MQWGPSIVPAAAFWPQNWGSLGGPAFGANLSQNSSAGVKTLLTLRSGSLMRLVKANSVASVELLFCAVVHWNPAAAKKLTKTDLLETGNVYPNKFRMVRKFCLPLFR